MRVAVDGLVTPVRMTRTRAGEPMVLLGRRTLAGPAAPSSPELDVR